MGRPAFKIRNTISLPASPSLPVPLSPSPSLTYERTTFSVEFPLTEKDPGLPPSPSSALGLKGRLVNSEGKKHMHVSNCFIFRGAGELKSICIYGEQCQGHRRKYLDVYISLVGKKQSQKTGCGFILTVRPSLMKTCHRLLHWFPVNSSRGFDCPIVQSFLPGCILLCS